MKKVLPVLLAVVLMLSLSVSAFAASMTPSVDKTSIKAGEQVTVTLSLDAKIENVITIAYKLYYNADLFTIDVDNDCESLCAPPADVTVSEPQTEDNQTYVKVGTLDTKSKGQALNAGPIVKLTFTAKAEATPGQASFTAEFENFMDTTFKTITTGYGAGPAATVTVIREYSVTVSGTGAANVTAAQKATYGTDYSFTLNKAENYDYTVAVTIGGTDVTPTLGEDGKTYTVAGASITGNIAIHVTKTQKAPTTTTVSFTGSGAGDVAGGASQTAANGQDFTFTVNKAANYDYTVKLGDEILTESNGQYTIPAAKLTGAALTVTVEKTEKLPEITTTAITFTGSGSGNVAGGKDQTATNGTDFTFTIDEKAGYTYTVKLGEETLTKANGKYTIPGAMLTGTALTVTVEKTAKTGEKPLPTPVGPKPEKPEKPSEPGTTEPTKPAHSFDDVPAGAYYEEAVAWAAEKGITEGTSANTFAPKALCTRAQVVTFLWRAAGCPEPQNAGSFADVTAGSYYAKAVAWAIENGITGGTGDGMFSPDAVCTRAQAVTFLYRASAAPAVDGSSSFSDVDADAYYMAAVRWAEQNGITGGIGGGLFGSDLDCTREQIVTFIFRMMAD